MNAPETTSVSAPQSETTLATSVPPASNGAGSQHDEHQPLAVLDGPFIIRELKDLGPNLPIGILVDGKRARPFRLRPMRMKEEKLIGKFREKTKAMTMGQFGSAVLSTMVQTVGPYSFDIITDEGERRLRLAQMTMGDVLYMYLYLRYETLGSDLTMNLQCPNCRFEFAFDADLGTTKVRTIPDDIGDLTRDYKLRDGLMVKGQLRKTLKLHPLLWGAFERKEFNTLNVAARNAATLRSSIVGVEGVDTKPFVCTDDDLDEMTKYDISGLITDIEDFSPGPLVGVEADCPGCQFSWKTAIDWTYDSFFSRSSRSTRRMF